MSDSTNHSGSTLARKRLVHVGQYVAEVSVELIETDSDWSPYLSVEDAFKLDDVRAAIKDGDLALAAKYGTR